MDREEKEDRKEEGGEVGGGKGTNFLFIVFRFRMLYVVRKVLCILYGILEF